MLFLLKISQLRFLIQFLIHNHTIFNLQKFIHENEIVKFDGIIKIWKITLMKIAIAHVPLCANAQLNLIVVVPAGNNH